MADGKIREEKFKHITDVIIPYYGEFLIDRYKELTWRPEWQSCVKDTYETVRLCIHNEMRKEPTVYDHRIDRHKVAAAFTKAIIQVRPLMLKQGISNPSPGARLANEALAFASSVRISRQFLVRRFKDVPEWSERIAEEAIKYPPASDGDFIAHAYKAFFNATPGSLNGFILANLYFLIESYHLRSLGWNEATPGQPGQY